MHLYDCGLRWGAYFATAICCPLYEDIVLIKRRRDLIFLALSLLALLPLGSTLAQDERRLIAFDVCWSADGRWIGIGSTDGIWVFDADDLEAEPYHYGSGPSFVAAFNPVRPEVPFANDEESQTRVVEIETGDEVFIASTPPDDNFPVYYDLGYSDDGRYLAVLNSSLLHVLDGADGSRIRSYFNPIGDGINYSSTEWLTALNYDPETGAFLAGDWSGNLFAFDPEGEVGAQRYAPDVQTGSLWLEDFELIPGTRQVVLQSGRALNRYDLESDVFAPLGDWGELPVSGFDISPDGTLLAVGSGALWVLYDLAEDAQIGEFPSEFLDPTNEYNRLYALAFSPENDRLVTLQTDGRVYVWDVAAGEVIAGLGEFTGAVSQKWG